MNADGDTKIDLSVLKGCIYRGGGWFRLFGYGLKWKDTRRFPLIFSERNSYTKHLMLGSWSFSVHGPVK
jgi:hypothetical protein